MEKALGESRHRSQTSGCGKSFISTVKRDRQPNTTVSMEPTVLANLGFLNNGVSMKEKKICGRRERKWRERRPDSHFQPNYFVLPMEITRKLLKFRILQLLVCCHTSSTYWWYPIEEDEDENNKEITVGEQSSTGGNNGHQDGHEGHQDSIQQAPWQPVIQHKILNNTHYTNISVFFWSNWCFFFLTRRPCHRAPSSSWCPWAGAPSQLPRWQWGRWQKVWRPGPSRWKWGHGRTSAPQQNRADPSWPPSCPSRSKLNALFSSGDHRWTAGTLGMDKVWRRTCTSDRTRKSDITGW